MIEMIINFRNNNTIWWTVMSFRVSEWEQIGEYGATIDSKSAAQVLGLRHCQWRGSSHEPRTPVSISLSNFFADMLFCITHIIVFYVFFYPFLRIRINSLSYGLKFLILILLDSDTLPCPASVTTLNTWRSAFVCTCPTAGKRKERARLPMYLWLYRRLRMSMQYRRTSSFQKWQVWNLKNNIMSLFLLVLLY